MGENLGQHFLTDQSVARDMVRAANLGGDTVVEVGPGEGQLTDHLLETAKRVIAIEKDPELARGLQKKYETAIANNQLEVIKGDVRDVDPGELTNHTRYKVVANIPYYLTSELLRQLLTNSHQPESITALIQKEVASRIVAHDEDESVMSLSVKAYGEPELVRSVPAGAFNPPPKVDSAILHINPISRDFFANTDEVLFFKLVKAGFIHKRKTLVNNLEAAFDHKSKEEIYEIMANCSVSRTIRAQKLTLTNWMCLCHNWQTNL